MIRNKRWTRSALVAILGVSLSVSVPVRTVAQDDGDATTKTPIKHVVIIFQENVSFDHYFGTYPHAQPNTDKSVYLAKVKDDTPRVNSLESSGLLANNPNGVNPFRIDRSHPVTCDEDHSYTDEQYAADNGLMDHFTSLLPYTTPPNKPFSCNDTGAGGLGPNSVMGYYDGNTVTALWNYAQHFAMSDNSFGTTFGPSTPGLLNLVAGNTYMGTIMNGKSGAGNIANSASSGAVVGDPDPSGDICSAAGRAQILMSGQNVGDLLNAAHITWGAFMGGFSSCTVSHVNVAGATVVDYIPHHAFFQYWTSTANPNHLPPTTVAMIGYDDQAKHQYDLSNFYQALSADKLPAVSILKAAAYQDGHAGYSDPLDEQQFLVQVINALQQSNEWKETAVIIAYDDSDGWYDHQMGPIDQQSNVADDRLVGPGSCASLNADGSTKKFAQNGRCGLGPRLPLLVVSPWAKRNFVDHRVTDQSSILRFIEDNWALPRIGGGSTDAAAGTLNGMFDFDDTRRGEGGARKLTLDPTTGKVVGE
jgi:phospholipase C